MDHIISKHVQTVMVTDPDTGGLCEVEIRKIEGGPLVGLDGAFLDQTEDDAFSPYDKDVVIVIPDGEEKVDYSIYPHVVSINYGDGVNLGLYHYPNEKLAKQHVAELLAERLGNIHADDDDGTPFSYKIAHALKNGDVDEAATLYGQVPDNLEVIEYSPVHMSVDTPLKGNPDTLNGLLADYLEK